MRLVADVGGTNTRVALTRDGTVHKDTIKSHRNDDFGHLRDVIETYVAAHPETRIDDMVIAMAGPTDGETARLTNRDWFVDAAAFAAHFGVADVTLMNDLTALGYAVPGLGDTQLKLIHAGAGPHPAHPQSLVVGIGTGFNVSPVMHFGDHVFCPSVEGGHIGLSSYVLDAMQGVGDPGSMRTVEHLFSGRGFAGFCRMATGRPDLGGEVAIAAYGTDAEITAAVDHYATLMGWQLRDLTMSYMPKGGFYFAGSVSRAVLSKASDKVIAVLREPCALIRHADIPIHIIDDDLAALHGVARFSMA
ncbi:glucokinase [Sulfitobacter sp. S190]|uniref:glucokinase n=1 Tax=Sulfitobacter sp. S190 TaxID=2867022 RepID=UPI0021A95765|nr:glucokinase [Sulfitobacter sp. S190]UWR21906.1 glucokinase [Sulfitobacter sp. S190]